jgi:hypothetical protein
MVRSRAHIGLLCLLAGCADAGAGAGAPVARSAALGQPNGDYPSYDERVVLYATNRARADPAKEGWPSYAAQPPLQWSYPLNQSARAHSDDMRDTPCFQHDSCDGTSVWTRIVSFFTTPYQSIGENISAGVPDGLTVVYNWIWEIGAAAGETGHRDNIFSGDFTLLGPGFAPGGTQFDNYWTQDFVGNPITRPRLGDGIHFPDGPASGQSLTFGTTYYDEGGQKASSVSVVVDGHCRALAQVRGAGNPAAFEAALTLTDGCHAYYFIATVGASSARYPDSGSLQVAVGAAGSCPLFVASATAADCASSPAPTPDGGVAPSPHDGGALVSPARGADAAPSPDSGSTAQPAAGDPGAAPAVGRKSPSEDTPSDVQASSGCALAGRAPSGAGALAALGLLALALAPRRRRA